VNYKFEPVRIEADIEIVEETNELKEIASSIVNFPEHKTPDLLFFSGIFVSSGENLNHAYFMPSELIKASNSINNKALDMEHQEDQIVGHIYSSKFIDESGSELNIDELASVDSKELDKMNMDILIAGILYKSRFPELAKEISEKRWKLSMEAYYSNYDLKIGNTIMSRKEAEALGYANEIVGKLAKILKKGKEIAKGEVSRVLRNILFSGCGVVKNPANPRSVILETAKKQKNTNKGAEIVIDLDKLDNSLKEEEEEADISVEDVRAQTSVGICVSFKKRVIDATYEGPDVKIIHENWCTLYEMACTSSSRDVTDPNCLKRQAAKKAKNYVESKLKELKGKDKRKSLLFELETVLKDIKK